MTENEAGLVYTISGREMRADRPEPIIPDIEVYPYKRRMEPQMAIDALVEGHYVLIVDFYSSGLTLLLAIREYVKLKYPDLSFQGQRAYRSAFRELSHRLLLLVNNHKLAVRKAPEIGWLKILYPGLSEFLLPFPQVQGLNSAWQWYQKGIIIPGLNLKIHPWYGTYFPTRFEHLKLFDNWLKQYKGARKSAMDIGIGSGVLTFQLLRHGFEQIYGTDSNPNAIIGIHQAMQGNKLSPKIKLMFGDLLAGYDQKAELIVFNPPWLPAARDSEGIDKAIYYDDKLFPRFFAEAGRHLAPGGHVVLLFSNLAQITGTTEDHPIAAELASGKIFQKELFLQKNVASASENTRRDQNWRAAEMVELWVLKLRDIP